MSTSINLESFTNRNFHDEPVGRGGIKRIVEHGAVLKAPAHQPEGTTNDVTYEVGFCAQLDSTHCLLIASMDEQGGGDLCVGNDAFVFESLADIRADRAVPVNRVDTDYTLKSGRKAMLAKFPGPVGFIPLGSKLEDGSAHPGAGSGFFLSGCVAKEGMGASMEPESPFELVQLRWDGEKLHISPGVLIDELLGLMLGGNASITNAVPYGKSLLLTMGVHDKFAVFQFDWNGEAWDATRHSELFGTKEGRVAIPGEEHSFQPGEMEPSLHRQGGRFLVYTRGEDPVGRLYESKDGIHFKLIATRANHTVPQVMNMGLDGRMYVATNPGPGWLRNPLLAFPLEEGDKWGEPFTLHDEEGIRGDTSGRIPFIDHSVASNVFLEGRWRHLNFFRNCDLTERTLHTFQINMGMDKLIYGEGRGPRTSKLPSSGLYVTELEYE